MTIAHAMGALTASHRFALPVLPRQLHLVGVRYLDTKYGGKRRFLHEFFRLNSVFAQSSNVDHLCAAVLKAVQMRSDRLQLLSLLCFQHVGVLDTVHACFRLPQMHANCLGLN